MLGLDAETGVIMLLYQDIVYEQRRREGRLNNRQDLMEAVHDGAAAAPPAQAHDGVGQHPGIAARHVGHGHRRQPGQTHRRAHGGGRGHLLFAGIVDLPGDLLAPRGQASVEMARRGQAKGCDTEFKKDPEKYLKKMESQGITPEKSPAGAGQSAQ
jgi:hypothetical protein